MYNDNLVSAARIVTQDHSATTVPIGGNDEEICPRRLSILFTLRLWLVGGSGTCPANLAKGFQHRAHRLPAVSRFNRQTFHDHLRNPGVDFGAIPQQIVGW